MGILFQNGFFTQANNPSFTITSNMFDTVQYAGSVCGNNAGEWDGAGLTGFTIAQSTDLGCGVYGYLSGYTQVETAFTSAGANMDWRGYIFNVTWGTGSTITNGVAKVAYSSYDHLIRIISVDPTDIDYLNNNGNGGDSISLPGTFNFPATFTFRTPTIEKGGWC